MEIRHIISETEVLERMKAEEERPLTGSNGGGPEMMLREETESLGNNFDEDAVNFEVDENPDDRSDTGVK